jgi:hypothetical protein
MQYAAPFDAHLSDDDGLSMKFSPDLVKQKMVGICKICLMGVALRNAGRDNPCRTLQLFPMSDAFVIAGSGSLRGALSASGVMLKMFRANLRKSGARSFRVMP